MGGPCGPWTWMNPPSVLSTAGFALASPPTVLASELAGPVLCSRPARMGQATFKSSPGRGAGAWGGGGRGLGRGGLQFYDGKTSLKQSHHLFWPCLHVGHPEDAQHTVSCPPLDILSGHQALVQASSLSILPLTPCLPTLPRAHRVAWQCAIDPSIVCNISRASISDPPCPQR